MADAPQGLADERVLAARAALQAAIEPSPHGPTAAADLHELLAMQAELAVALAARLQVVDATETWQRTGSKAQWAWLARHSATGTAAPMSAGTARGLVRLATGLRSRPAVERLLRSAQISEGHATVLLTQLSLLGQRVVGTSWSSPTWLAAQEQAFCDRASLTDPLTLQRELGIRIRALAPELAGDDDRDRVAHRTASLTPGYDGMWDLTGTLDPDSGQVLKAALLAWRRTDHVAGDPRAPGQRDVDALVGIARSWLQRTDSVTRGSSPQLVVLVPEARMAAHQAQRDHVGLPVVCPDSGLRLPDPMMEPLLTRDGQLLPHGDPGGSRGHDDPWGHGDPPGPDLPEPVPPATYTDGTPVPETTLQQLLCTATLTRLVLDADSAVLDVGRATRVFSHHQWLASMTLWQWRCATDGCQAPADRLELHHAVWWRDGGRTDLDNCVPLCHGTVSCHSRVHDGATLRLRDGQLLDRRGLRPLDLVEDDTTVWPPPLTSRARRRSRASVLATERLERILSRRAA